MSYFIAKKLKITPTKIIMRGGDNNVVPREDNELIIERNEKNDIEFCKEILGGCIQPTMSVDGGFWKWIRMKLRDRFDWYNPELINKEFWQMVSNRKPPKQKCIIELYNVDGNGKYVEKITSKAMYPTYSLKYAKRYNYYQSALIINSEWLKNSYPNMKMIAV